jgi:spore germination protein KB
MSRQSISQSNFMVLVTSLIIGTALMFIPSALIVSARQDALLALFLGMLPSAFLILVLSSLQSKFPGKTLIEYSDEILGPYLGKFVSLIFLWFIFHLSSLILRNIGDFISLAVLPKTPAVVIQGVVAITAAFAVRSGIEVITRITIIIMPVAIALFIIIDSVIMPKAILSRLLPLMENSLMPVIKAAIIPASFPFGIIVVFAMILNHVDSLKRINKFAILGVLIGFTVLALATFRSITVIGVDSSARYVYPALEAIGEAPASYILKMLMTISWYVIMFIELIICYFALNLGLGQLLGLKYHQSIVMPVGIIITAFSVFVYQNIIEEIYFASQIWPVYSIPIEYGIPFLIWIIAKLRY